jgi:hypothetical protein
MTPRSARSSAAGRRVPPCPGGGAESTLSGPSDVGGAASPVQAAQSFVAHASGDPDRTSSWWVGERDPAGGVTLRAGLLWLHAKQLSDGSWVIDAGGRCT